MPRDGSGVYSKPAGTTASPNTTIESAKYNAFCDDLVTDANAARPITAGGTGAVTAALARTALAVPGLATENVFTKTQIWAKGADVASAAALNTTDDGNYFDITGTTAITSIVTVGVGAVLKLHFDGILTLTHHATDLILPGGANITTAAGDEAEFVEYATGDWRCTNYQRATGLSVVSALTTLTAATLSGTSTTVTGIPAGAKHVSFNIQNASLSSATNILVQLGTSGGVETADYSAYSRTNGASGATSTAGFIIIANDATGSLRGRIELDLTSSASNEWQFRFSGTDSVINTAIESDGYTTLSGELTQVRFTSVSGLATWDDGKAYGRVMV